MRHRPIQQRARKRVEQILDATAMLVAERGVVAFRVSDVAERAGVPIGSIYQYFENKEEMLRSLIGRYFAVIEERFQSDMANTESIDSFIVRVENIIRYCVNSVNEDAAFRELFLGANAWEIVRVADWDDTMMNATTLAQVLRKFVPNLPEAQILAFCVIICDSAGSTTRISMRYPEMADMLFEEYMNTIKSRIYALVRENVERRIAALGNVP